MALNVVPIILLPTVFIPAVAGLLFTAGGTNGAIIKKGSFSNITGSNVSLTLWRVPSGTSGVSNGLIITSAVNVPANSLAFCPQELINLVLNTGDSIWGLTNTVSALTGTISGFTF